MKITLEKLRDRYRNIRNYSKYNNFDYELSLNVSSSSPLVQEVLSLIGREDKADVLHLSVILANLLGNYSDHGFYTAFTWDGKKIVSSVNGFGLKQNRIKDLMTLLLGHGLAEQHKGGRNKKTGETWRSKIRASIDLVDIVRSFYPDGLELSRPEFRETIRLRGKAPEGEDKGKLIDYKVTREVLAMQRRLIRYNKLMEKSTITLDEAKVDRDVVKSINSSLTFTYRVFNEGKWNRGGRLYGGFWVQCPKELRQHILIDREPTVEVDFSNQHLVLLYAMEGIHYGDSGSDGYEIYSQSGRAHARHVMKGLFTIAVNCSSDKMAISAFHWARDRKEATARNIGEAYSSYPRLSDGDLQNILDKFRDAHEGVAGHLCQDAEKGLYLQYLDSVIADEILRVMTKKKIVTLSIHDSFICAIQHEAVLIQAITDAYFKIVRRELSVESGGVLRLTRKFQGEKTDLSTEFGVAA